MIDKDDNEKTVNKICNEISKIYLKKNDVKDLSIHPKSKEELLRMLDSNDLEKIAVCKFGNYASQSALTILRTKQYDIMHNTLEVKGEDISISKREGGDKGICFWAYGRSKTNEYRKYLSFDETDCAPRYLILPYVQSQLYATSKSDGAKQKNKDNLNFNPEDDESVEDFLERMKKYYKEGEEKARNSSFEDRLKYDKFAFGYAWNRRNVNNKKGIKKHYPADMFPAVIRKFTCNDQGGIGDRNSVAFLISEFDYIDVPIDIDKFYEYFTSNTGRVLNKSLKGQNGVSCAKLSDKEGLKKYLSGCYDDKDDGEIRVFLARIEYPYVAALVKDPM